jgi:hypothetical protein
MMRRIVTATALLAGLVAALAVAGPAEAATSSHTPIFTVKTDHGTYTAKQTITLTVHLHSAGAEVSVYEQVPGKAKALIARDGAVNSAGNYVLKGTAVANATFTATYGGSSYWRPATAHTTVKVRALVAEKIYGYYKTSHGYKLVHNGSKATLVAGVAPDKAEHKVYFPIQAYLNKKWRTQVDHAYTLTSKSAVAASFTCPKNYRCRIRAEYHGDKTNAANSTGWTYVKFV